MYELDEFDESDTNAGIMAGIRENIEKDNENIAKVFTKSIVEPPPPAAAPPAVAVAVAQEIEIPELYVIYFCIMYLLSISRENKGNKDEIRLVVLALCMAQSKHIKTHNMQIKLTQPQINSSAGFFPPNQTLNDTVKGIFVDFKKPQGPKKGHLESGKRLHIIVNPNSNLNTNPSEYIGEKFYKRNFTKREVMRPRVNGGAYLKNNIKRRHYKRRNKTIKTKS